MGGVVVSGSTALRLFREMGLRIGEPGFYDDPRFIAEEEKNPEFLEMYAAFVRERRYSNGYLDRARRTIRQAVEFLYDGLHSENQLGRCIDASMVLVRFLEREGIWAYGVKGGLSLTLPTASGLPTQHFAPIVLPGNPAATGHCWVYAPPYRIVDATVRLQPFSRTTADHLPRYLLARDVTPASFEAEDLIDPDAVKSFVASQGRLPTLIDVEAIAPGILGRVRDLGAFDVRRRGTRLRYVGTAVAAPQESLEEWSNLSIRGKLPIELYREFQDDLE
jgi:hypothetical protein